MLYFMEMRNEYFLIKLIGKAQKIIIKMEERNKTLGQRERYVKEKIEKQKYMPNLMQFGFDFKKLNKE